MRWAAPGAAHASVFSLAEAEQVPVAAVVTVKLAFESAWARHAAGRFRLSVTDRANTAISDYVVAAIDAGELHGVAALGGAYWVSGDDRAALRWLTLAAENEDASPTEHFLLAMAQHNLNDRAAAQQSYQRAMAALDRNQVSEPLQALAQRAAVDIGGLLPDKAVAAVRQAQAAAQLAALTASIEQNPAAQEPYRARGHFFAGRARWKEAADDWRQVLRIAPETDFFWIERAALFAIVGDRVAYREHCRQMLDRFQDTQDAFTADKVVKACSLLPDAFDDMTALRGLARRRLTLDAGNPWHGVLQSAAALADYRGGDFEAAEAHLKSVRAGSMSAPYQALFDAVSALVSHKLNDHAAARRHLDAASDLIRTNVPDFSRAEAFQLDWVIAEILRREAASLIEASQGPPATLFRGP